MPRIQHKRGTSANLASVNPTPLAGELVWDSTENAIKIGDGSTAWTSLAYVTATPRSHVHDGGDITTGTVAYARLPVGSAASTICAGNDARLSDTRTPTDGTVTTAKIANDAVTYAKIQNVTATDRILGRSTAGAGDIEEIVCTSFARTLLDDTTNTAARTTLGAAATSHTHGNITNAGAIGSTANLPLITTTSGVIAAGSFGTAANTFCQGSDARLARAWVNFKGTGTVTVRSSYNVSSITDNGVGDYTINFTTAMPDDDYAALLTTIRSSTWDASGAQPVSRTVNGLRVWHVENSVNTDTGEFNALIIG